MQMQKIGEMDKLLLLLGLFMIGGSVNILVKSETLSFLTSMGGIVVLSTYLMLFIAKSIPDKNSKVLNGRFSTNLNCILNYNQNI